MTRASDEEKGIVGKEEEERKKIGSRGNQGEREREREKDGHGRAEEEEDKLEEGGRANMKCVRAVREREEWRRQEER